jgi:radical SAM protein with 4Fe4S-binding SPASM domain
MDRGNAISPVAMMKLFWKHARHPWIGTRMAALIGEKWKFSAFGMGDGDGTADRIRQCSIRITDVCNLRCIMCGQWGENGFLTDRNIGDLKKNEVSPGRYIELLSDLKNHGHKPLMYIWGGEPMLYPGTLDIIRHAADLGMPPAIATNGTKLSAAAETFATAPLYLLQVSIDGHNSTLHNAIRRSPTGSDTFSEIMSGLEAVREARARAGGGLPLIASLTTISRENHQHLLDIYDRLSPLADMLVFYLSWWIDEKSAAAHEVDFERRFGQKPTLHRGWIGGWRPDDYAYIDEQLKELTARTRQGGRPPAIIIPQVFGADNLREYYTDHSNTFGFNRCVSIYQAVEIDSNGDMSPCRDYHDYIVGNVKDHTVLELWNSPRYKAFRKSLTEQGLMPACTRCCGLMGY